MLLAPKVWIGRHTNAFVAFANTNAQLESHEQSRPMHIQVVDQQGRVVYAGDHSKPENSTLLFDVRTAIEGRIALADEPVFFTVVAKGGASHYAIMTFIVNEATGNFALEHSLSPHYYMTGDQARVRQEALVLPAPART